MIALLFLIICCFFYMTAVVFRQIKKHKQIRQTIERIEKLEDTRAVEPLIKLLDDKYSTVRARAALALGALGDIRAVEPLIKLLKDWEWENRWRAAKVLGELGDVRAAAPLIPAIADPEWEVRWRASEAIGKLGDVRAVDPLIKRLQDYAPEVRKSAATSLGMLGDARAVEPLIHTLGNGHADVRKAAMAALKEIDAAHTVHALIQALRNDDSTIRENVTTILRSRDAHAAKYLTQGLVDGNSSVRLQVAEILEHIGWKPANERERTAYFVARRRIDTVIFGAHEDEVVDRNSMLSNPNTSELTVPMSSLKRIMIYSETYNFHLVESFFTYAVNYIGQDYLKKHVTVYVYGDVNQLHANLRNNLENLCKHMSIHEEYDIRRVNERVK